MRSYGIQCIWKQKKLILYAGSFDLPQGLYSVDLVVKFHILCDYCTYLLLWCPRY